MTERWSSLALFSALVLLPAGVRAEGPLSLEEAVRLSLAYNERSLKAPLRVEVAEGGLDHARSAFLQAIKHLQLDIAPEPERLNNAKR